MASSPNAEARKTGSKVFLFLKDKLKLPVKREKSGIPKPVGFEILGYRYVPTYEKRTKDKYQLMVSERSWKKLEGEVKVHGVARKGLFMMNKMIGTSAATTKY